MASLGLHTNRREFAHAAAAAHHHPRLQVVPSGESPPLPDLRADCRRPPIVTAVAGTASVRGDVLVASASAPELIANVDQLPALKSVARKSSVRGAASAVALIQDTRLQLRENVNPRLALEALALGLP